MTIATVILAAGFGTRMKSNRPKFLHTVAGRSLVEWSVIAGEAVSTLPPIVVVGHGREQVIDHLSDRVQYAYQDDQLGTGHAAWQAESIVRGQADTVIVIYADMPLLHGATLQKLAQLFEEAKSKGNCAVAMLTIERKDPQGFGRILRNSDGHIQAIVEEADCTPEQKLIRELNPGIYCFDAEWLWENFKYVPLSAKGEYYLTDMIGIAVKQGRQVVSTLADPDEVNGINNRVQLALAEKIMRQRIREEHMMSGVTIVDPDSTYIDDTVQIGQDVTILPGCLLQGNTTIGTCSIVGPYAQVTDSVIGNGCVITNSVIESATVANECEIGPFGHLRTGAILDTGVHMGNFGEVKNSYLGPGTKMGHFSYVGDAHLDGNVNIGAGTITCNYDGISKHKTKIGRDVFLGSDTLLVAPVVLEKGARTGAGSIVTNDVPANTLVYGAPAKQPQKQSREE